MTLAADACKRRGKVCIVQNIGLAVYCPGLKIEELGSYAGRT